MNFQRFLSPTLWLIVGRRYALVYRVEHAENKRGVEMDCSFDAEVCIWVSRVADDAASGVLNVPGWEIEDTREGDDLRGEAVQSQSLEWCSCSSQRCRTGLVEQL